MSRKRYGGFSDPEPEASNEVITEPEVAKESTIEIEDAAEPEAAKEVITKIEETTEPVTFAEEKTAEPIVESMELEVTSVQTATPNLPYKVTITTNALNIRTGPGSSHQAVGITKKGSVHKVLEEQDGWGRIGDNKWINLSKSFVEKD